MFLSILTAILKINIAIRRLKYSDGKIKIITTARSKIQQQRGRNHL
jgi:hypothetical protein